MKIILFLIVLLHGVLHILGFLKTFRWYEPEQLTAEISKPMGVIWLLATLLILSVAILILLDVSWWIYPALLSVMVSSVLIFSVWSDGKFGMIPNLILLVAVAISYSSESFQKKISSETQNILSTVSLSEREVISEKDIKNLPEPVQWWIQTTGILGKPPIKSARVSQEARMKMKPGQKDWYQAEALQFTVTEVPAFIWTVDLEMIPGVYIKGRDMFRDGKGEMLIKMNSLVNIVNESGPKLDEGTLQRFLGELVWFPSLALSPYIHWEVMDDQSSNATMTYQGITANGTFYFDEQGDFIKFIAMRYQGNEPNAKKYPWVLTVEDYGIFEGIRLPSKMKATWKLEEGDWTWLELEIKDIRYNVRHQ